MLSAFAVFAFSSLLRGDEAAYAEYLLRAAGGDLSPGEYVVLDAENRALSLSGKSFALREGGNKRFQFQYGMFIDGNTGLALRTTELGEPEAGTAQAYQRSEQWYARAAGDGGYTFCSMSDYALASEDGLLMLVSAGDSNQT